MSNPTIKNVVRYAIFYGNENIKIPSIIESFKNFEHDQNNKVISFELAEKSCIWDSFRNDIYSNDPQIKNFQNYFILANPNINHANLKSSFRYTPPLEYNKDDNNMILYGVIGGIALLLLLKKGKK